MSDDDSSSSASGSCLDIQLELDRRRAVRASQGPAAASEGVLFFIATTVRVKKHDICALLCLLLSLLLMGGVAMLNSEDGTCIGNLVHFIAQ